MKDTIRLTNKTAIALRKSAKNLRTAYFAAAVVLSIALGAAGVVLGFIWLPAVPLMIVAISLIDSFLMVVSRSKYLGMIGQAICTEAAAREMRASASESKRSNQAKSDMQRVKAAIREDVENIAAMDARAQGARPFFEDQEEKSEEEGASAPMAAPRRRRQQESAKPLQLIRK